MDEVELHNDFLRDLSDLLKKYDAELYTEFRSKGWHGEDVMVIEFKGIYDGKNKSEYSKLDIPKYLD